MSFVSSSIYFVISPFIYMIVFALIIASSSFVDTSFKAFSGRPTLHSVDFKKGTSSFENVPHAKLWTHLDSLSQRRSFFVSIERLCGGKLY